MALFGTLLNEFFFGNDGNNDPPPIDMHQPTIPENLLLDAHNPWCAFTTVNFFVFGFLRKLSVLMRVAHGACCCLLFVFCPHATNKMCGRAFVDGYGRADIILQSNWHLERASLLLGQARQKMMVCNHFVFARVFLPAFVCNYPT